MSKDFFLASHITSYFFLSQAFQVFACKGKQEEKICNDIK